MPNNLQTNEELVEQIRNSTGKDQSDLLMQLYNRNYGMIHKIAKQFSAFESIQDLEQQAYFGLRIAVDRYDPGKGVLFLSYATFWIRQSIKRYLDECGSVLRLPVYLREKIFQYDQIIKSHQRQFGKEPTNAELMRALSVDRKRLQQIKKYAVLIQPASLNKVISEDDDTYTLQDAIADPADHFQEIDDQVDNKILKNAIWNEVDLLGADPADVIKRRFRDQETLQAIGDVYGVSKERVRKILNDALRKLRLSKKIRQYADEYSAKAYSGTGLSAFLSSGSSSVERAAIDHYMKTLERTMQRVNKKYGIQVDEGFIQEQLAKRREEINTIYK